MPDPPNSNVKIYDRPQRTGPSPIMIVIVLLIVLAAGIFIYRSMHQPAPATAGSERAVSGQN